MSVIKGNHLSLYYRLKTSDKAHCNLQQKQIVVPTHLLMKSAMLSDVKS